MEHKHHYEYETYEGYDRIVCVAEGNCCSKWPGTTELNHWVELEETAKELITVCESNTDLGEVDKAYQKLMKLVKEDN